MNSVPAASEALWEAYRRTEYQIGPPFHVSLRVGHKAAGLPEGPWAYLTAWNPRSEQLPRLENRKRQFELESLLCDEGVRSYVGVAKDPSGEWPDEEGILVIGLSRERALEFGRQFSQNAILFGVGDGVVELMGL